MIIRKKNSSSFEDICTHFLMCDCFFISILSKDVNIEAYSKKLFEKAHRYEFWEENNLIGLLAIYLNASFIYISNISVVERYKGNKLGEKLLNDVIELAKTIGLPIRLDVHIANEKVIGFYEKFNFKVIEINENKFVLMLEINSNNL